MEKVENVSLKMEEGFVRVIEAFMKKHNYMTKTEFIREAIRDKITDLQKREMLKAVDNAFGSSKRKTTDEQLHEAGERAFLKLEKKHSAK